MYKQRKPRWNQVFCDLTAASVSKAQTNAEKQRLKGPLRTNNVLIVFPWLTLHAAEEHKGRNPVSCTLTPKNHRVSRVWRDR